MRRTWLRALVVAATCAAAPGCGDGAAAVPPACRDGGCQSQRSGNALYQTVISSDIDILFIVDDTSGVSARAEALAADYRKVAHLLSPATPNGLGPPSVHVAFVSATNAASANPEARAAECGVAPPGAFLATGKCGRMPNVTQFEDTFACLASLGNAATGNLEPFAALRRALDLTGSQALTNFLRPQAYLQIVIVAGQDDATPSPVEDFVRFLKSLKPASSKVLVSVVGPPVECGDAAAAMPAPRLRAFMEAFGLNGVYSTICRDNALSAAIDRVLNPIYFDLFWPMCMAGVRDTDPVTPGRQADCIVEDRNGEVPTALPPCDRAAPPCWRVKADPRCRPGEVEIEIDHGPDWCAQDGLNVLVTCLTCLHADEPACRSD